GRDTISLVNIAGNHQIDMTTGIAGVSLGTTRSILNFEQLDMGAGDDTVTGTVNADAIDGGDGDDSLSGMAGGDTLRGNLGNDLLLGGDDIDLIEGGEGNDTILASGGADTVLGGDGNDSIASGGLGSHYGEAGNDTIQARPGNGGETLDGGAGADWLEARSFRSDCIIHLTGGQTNMAGETVINFESVLTSVGNDRVFGTDGENWVFSGDGDDVILGYGGNDRLFGQGGADLLVGGDGNDLLFGGAANDVLRGGMGADQLIGEAGNDLFQFLDISDSTPGLGTDLISGFDGAGAAAGDRFWLSPIDANTQIDGDQAFVFKGTTAGGTGTIWLSNFGALTFVYVNNDADADPDMIIRIDDGAVQASQYTAADFIL
nr:hypothetical protein [Agrobacterium sp.]